MAILATANNVPPMIQVTFGSFLPGRTAPSPTSAIIAQPSPDYVSLVATVGALVSPISTRSRKSPTPCHGHSPATDGAFGQRRRLLAERTRGHWAQALLAEEPLPVAIGHR